MIIVACAFVFSYMYHYIREEGVIYMCITDDVSDSSCVVYILDSLFALVRNK